MKLLVRSVLIVGIATLVVVKDVSGVCNNTTCTNGGTCMNNSMCSCAGNYFGEICSMFLNLTAVESELAPIQGENVNLTVNSQGSIATVMVLIPNSPSFMNITNNHSSTHSYIIQKVNCSDIGTYIFKATTAGAADVEVNATVEISHVFTIAADTSHPHIFVEIGNSTSPAVNVTKGDCGTFSNVSVTVETPNAEKPCNPLMSDGASDNEKTYTCDIANTSMNDNGSYTFNVMESNGGRSHNISATVTLSVEVPPEEPVIMGNMTVLRGTGDTLTCSSNGAPNPTITWIYNGSSVSNDTSMPVHQIQNNGTLVFLAFVPFNDSGTYTCEAKNTLISTGNKTTNNTIDITIEGSPELETNQTLQMLDNVTLLCKADAFPEANITWTGVDLISDFINISQTSGPEFYQVSSTLEIQHSALCLGNKTITCTATNSRASNQSNFMINQAPYGVYENDYYIFIDASTKSQASQDCMDIKGELSTTTDNQTPIQTVADSIKVTEYAVGNSDCYENMNDNWGKAASCSTSIPRVCRIEATKAPTDLQLLPDPCDGRKLTVNWTPDASFLQMIKITHSGNIEKNETLMKNDSTKSFDSLEFGKTYTVKVSTGYDVCEHHAFAQAMYTSAYEEAEKPGNLTMELKETGCQISWSYPPERRKELNGFNIQVDEQVNAGNDAPINIVNTNVTMNTSTYNLSPTNPNSVYTATIKALSCIGASQETTKIGCQTRTALPVAAVVVPIVVILLLLLAVILFLYYRRRQKKIKKREEHYNGINNTHDNPAFAEAVYENLPKDRSIAVENLKSTYQTKHSDEDRLFREEYRFLATEVSDMDIQFTYAMTDEVREKNRFTNIFPANESRVVLRRQGADTYRDYINASYIDGYRQPRKFIAAQGPLTNTVGDFWYMVWEQESSVIVMLTKVEENGRRKCEKYWPDDHEEVTFENIAVKSISTVVYGSIINRTFELRNPIQSDKVLQIEQYHFLAWPDHGVPITTSTLLNLRRMIMECQGTDTNPIIVHCSAGVGRTGTFISLDILINQMDRENKVDIYNTVLKMRLRRKEMVQTVEQYALLHKLLLERYLFHITDLETSAFQEKFGKNAYEPIDVIEEQFFNLNVVPPMTTTKFLPENCQDQVRDEEIVPYLHCKVLIRMRPSEDKIPFLNASLLRTYDPHDSFIACQGPTESAPENFWRVVLDNNVTVIVMLTSLVEDGKEQCSQYWPESIEVPINYGGITVNLQSENEQEGYIERWITVSENVLHLKRSLNVVQLHLAWPVNSVPENTKNFLGLVAKTQASRTKIQGRTMPVLVHCSDGAGRTGTFCAIVNLIERLKNEDRVDVFRTVKDLRDMRPLMVRTMDQYHYCYKVVQRYLDSFETYSNFK